MRAFIEKRRKDSKMTQAKMAEKVNMSRRSWQRGVDGAMTVDELVAVGKILKFRVILLPEECELG